MPFGTYLRQIEEKLQQGNATEHTHRPALQALLEAIGENTSATNEPKRIACGAPDFVLHRDGLTVGYAEAKDVGKSLDTAEDTDQLRRYKEALPNLILTDYIEFRWFVDGDHRMTARLARPGPNGALRLTDDGEAQVRTLLQSALSQQPEPIASAQALTERMAQLTHVIRDIVVEAFRQGEASDLLRDLRTVFAETLVPAFDQPAKLGEFADMFAQTLAYGLFAARVHHDDGGGDFRRLGAAGEIPKTNPFLRHLFSIITGPRLADEPYAGFVDDLVQLLRVADIRAVLEDFGARTRQEDPILHFYETFLQTYDPEERVRRGVYYTPTPVVSYITRSVDHILKTDFALDGGLADRSTFTHEYREDDELKREDIQRVLVLDPACGTGTFLYHIVDHIRGRFMQEGNAGLWNGFVKNHLLPRLFGFERLMASYAAAHLKLGMQLAGQDLSEAQRLSWAYDFAGDERLQVYLTDTLADPEREVQRYPGPLRIFSEEAEAASRVKNHLPLLVITGNPPYANFGQANNAPWISDKLTEAWKPRGEKKWNPDDFMKFMRWAEWRLNEIGQGVLAFITSRTYLDGITHRTMRERLRESFDDIYLLDLHGGIYETPPDGARDENVFDITKGVAIGLFVKKPPARAVETFHETSLQDTAPTRVFYKELWGKQAAKYDWLGRYDASDTDWQELTDVDRPTCLGNFYFFAPKAFDYVDEYCEGWSVEDIFQTYQNGLKTDRDSLFFDFDRDTLKRRIQKFYSEEGVTDRAFREEYNVENSSSYPLLNRRETTDFDGDAFHQCTYRPFDSRWLYYKPGLTSRPAWGVMKHMLAGDNVGIITTRQTRDEWGLTVTDTLCGHKSCSAYDINSFFPLYLYPDDEDLATSGSDMFSNGRRPNLSAGFVEAVKGAWGLRFIEDGAGDLEDTFGPEDVLHYAYAVFHSPAYRARYEELLRIDFPRLPVSEDLELVRALCAEGRRLLRLHLMRAGGAGDKPGFPVAGTGEVTSGHPDYRPPSADGETPGRVYINEEQYFEGVEPAVWAFHVGGYQVCEKWLKDRKGRALSYDEIEHYRSVVAVLRETMQRMEQIDRRIDEAGGWPLA